MSALNWLRRFMPFLLMVKGLNQLESVYNLSKYFKNIFDQFYKCFNGSSKCFKVF